MRKVLLVALLLLFCGAYAAAQVEAFVGYSYLKLDIDDPKADNSVPGGFNADATYYFVKHLGLTADFQYHKKSWTNDPVLGNIDGSIFNFHAGPRFKAHLGKAEPFVHALFGVTHVSFTPAGGSTSFSDNAFSMKLGGGLDVAVARHFAIRVAEANYYMTKFAGAPNNSVVNFNANGDGRQNNSTFSAGLVIR